MPNSFKFSLIIRGILISALIALVLSLLFSLLLTFTRTPESNLSLQVIFAVSVFLGAALTSYQTGARGLYYGLSIGVGFILFLLIIFTILAPTSPSWLKFGERTVISLTSGAVGGIIGVVVKR